MATAKAARTPTPAPIQQATTRIRTLADDLAQVLPLASSSRSRRHDEASTSKDSDKARDHAPTPTTTTSTSTKPSQTTLRQLRIISFSETTLPDFAQRIESYCARLPAIRASNPFTLARPASTSTATPADEDATPAPAPQPEVDYLREGVLPVLQTVSRTFRTLGKITRATVDIGFHHHAPQTKQQQRSPSKKKQGRSPKKKSSKAKPPVARGAEGAYVVYNDDYDARERAALRPRLVVFSPSNESDDADAWWPAVLELCQQFDVPLFAIYVGGTWSFGEWKRTQVLPKSVFDPGVESGISITSMPPIAHTSTTPYLLQTVCCLLDISFGRTFLHHKPSPPPAPPALVLEEWTRDTTKPKKRRTNTTTTTVTLLDLDEMENVSPVAVPVEVKQRPMQRKAAKVATESVTRQLTSPRKRRREASEVVPEKEKETEESPTKKRRTLPPVPESPLLRRAPSRSVSPTKRPAVDVDDVALGRSPSKRARTTTTTPMSRARQPPLPPPPLRALNARPLCPISDDDEDADMQFDVLPATPPPASSPIKPPDTAPSSSSSSSSGSQTPKPKPTRQHKSPTPTPDDDLQLVSTTAPRHRQQRWYTDVALELARTLETAFQPFD